MTALPDTHPTSATRYTNLIYAAALRQTKDPHLAADITQAVFLVLLKKSQSGKAPEEQRMTGWLLQVTHYIIRETRRASFRRRRRELATPTPAPSSPHAHPDITDTLDTALLTLNPTDREIIARRYLHEEPVDSLAAALGLSQNTASKRITRALEKLRIALLHKGITTPTALLTATLATQATIKSPIATASPLAHDLARRLLWHSLLVKTASITAIIAACVLITAVTTFLAFHATASTEAVASAPAVTQTQTQAATPDDHAIQRGAVLEESSDRLIADVLAGIENCKAKLKTLQVDATYATKQRFPDGTVTESQTVGTGWIDVATGHFRIEISFNRTPWLNGAAPFLDDSFWTVWDGEKARILHVPPHSIRGGEIRYQEVFANGRLILGRIFSTQLSQELLMGHDHHEMKIDPLARKSLETLRLAARRVILNGREAMELETRFKLPDSLKGPQRHTFEQLTRTYWFDPSRGYALLAYQEAYGDQPSDQTIIDELTEAAPGIFYPTRARIIRYARDPVTPAHPWYVFLRGEFHATRVTANQPLDPSLFRLDFPPGISISDAASSQPTTHP